MTNPKLKARFDGVGCQGAAKTIRVIAAARTGMFSNSVDDLKEVAGIIRLIRHL